MYCSFDHKDKERYLAVVGIHFLIFVYLKGRETEREGYRERSFVCWIFPQVPAAARVGVGGEARS